MPGKRSGRAVVLALATAILAAGCGGQSTSTEAAPPSEDEVTAIEPSECADVIDVMVTPESPGTYRFDVTVRSPDTGWDKYADLWEVRAPDGAVLGERVLAHPHVEEQPFTRGQSGISVPDGIETVQVVARDSMAGFCGMAFEVELD